MDDDNLLTIFEVSRITKYTVGTLRKLVQRKEIPYRKIRRSLRFRRDELNIWIQSGGSKVVFLPDDNAGDPDAAENGGRPATERENGGAASGGPELPFPPEDKA
jgi:excisionase family DNA binding protein